MRYFTFAEFLSINNAIIAGAELQKAALEKRCEEFVLSLKDVEMQPDDGVGGVDMVADAASVVFYNDMNIPRSAYVFDGQDWLYKAGQDPSLWVPLEQSPSLMRIARNGN